MYLETQIKEIEKLFVGLKADVMVAEPEGQERQNCIDELVEQEKQAKASAENSYKELQGILKNTNLLAKSLKLPISDTLQVLIYRELNQIHFHIDSRIPS